MGEPATALSTIRREYRRSAAPRVCPLKAQTPGTEKRPHDASGLLLAAGARLVPRKVFSEGPQVLDVAGVDVIGAFGVEHRG
jgi:hypothetical protein